MTFKLHVPFESITGYISAFYVTRQITLHKFIKLSLRKNTKIVNILKNDKKSKRQSLIFTLLNCERKQ